MRFRVMTSNHLNVLQFDQNHPGVTPTEINPNVEIMRNSVSASIWKYEQ